MIGFFYDLFYMLPLGIAMLFSAIAVDPKNVLLTSAADGTTIPSVPGCVVSAVFIILILVIRHSGKKERVLVTGVMTVAAISLFWILGKENRVLLFNKYNWTLTVFVISIIAIVIGRIAEDFLKAKIVISIIILSAVFYMMINKIQCPKGTVSFCFLVILIYAMEIIQRSWVKSGYADVKKHVAYIAPIIMIMAIVVTLIPAPAKKFDWKFAKNIWKVTVTEYKRLVGTITAEREEYAYTGFSENGGIGSSVSDNGREVLLITSDMKSFDRLYMGGMVYEDFDGKKWSTKLDSKPGDRELDYVETKAAISKFNQGYEGDYFKTDNIKVESRLFNTKYVFAPVKTNMYSSKTTLPKYKETESKIIADKKIKYGNSYNVDYMQLNFDNPDLLLLADTATVIDENEWRETVRKSNLASATDLSFDRYLEYQNNVYEKYGGNRELTMEEALENSQLSDEVKQIVRDIIGNDKIGDFEKLKAVSDYLQTMEYTKKTEALPKEIDNATAYLDYFILKSQSGYCVHYATAFTLLARQLGHPARYVQGYYVERKDVDTLVTENKAHAWAEVYFDNFGWMIFEATPGYSVSRGWSVSRTTGDKKGIYQNHAVINDTASNVSMDELPQEEEKNYVYILYFVIPLICAILFGIIYLLISRIIAGKKYRKMNEEDKVRTMIGKNMRILKILGYMLYENETLDEYKRKIERDNELAEHIGFLKFYENLLYSDYEVSASDVEAVESDYLLLKNSLRSRGVKYRFYIV
ncbi:MAG: transglutaminase-like domain-containing protein [Lachnospiraceae bacterium]|nr:transglutaminase-like domain-containing protein [Lachnospiraceae bacterium]MDO4966930.1 transglutaminase-like domain-containing protein [Lachnospiraceae bacterium]